MPAAGPAFALPRRHTSCPWATRSTAAVERGVDAMRAAVRMNALTVQRRVQEVKQAPLAAKSIASVSVRAAAPSVCWRELARAERYVLGVLTSPVARRRAEGTLLPQLAGVQPHRTPCVARETPAVCGEARQPGRAAGHAWLHRAALSRVALREC